MLNKLYPIVSSPFFKLPLLLGGVILVEKGLLSCYTYLESTEFDLL